MRITIEKGQVHNVSIQSGFTGPLIDLNLSPALAYELLRELGQHRETLRDLVQNYYECSECGETHAKAITMCPNIDWKEEQSGEKPMEEQKTVCGYPGCTETEHLYDLAPNEWPEGQEISACKEHYDAVGQMLLDDGLTLDSDQRDRW